MIRVLLLPSWYLPEGGEFVREQAIQLQKRGVDARILAPVSLPYRKYPLSAVFKTWRTSEYIDEGVPVMRRYLRRIPGGSPAIEERNIILWTQQTLRLFEQFVERYGLPEIIHAHSATWAGYAAALIKDKYGVPYVITEHRSIFCMQSEMARLSFRDFYTPYLAKAFCNAERILSPSAQMFPKICEYLNHDVPLEELSNIVDTTFFGVRINTALSPYTFVAINSYNPNKAYDILLPAFDKVCDEYPETRLTLLGDFSAKDFQLLLARCRHRNNIRFTGFLPPAGVRDELYRSHAFVLPSRVEAQCISVLEALSTGTQVIVTECVPEYTAPKELAVRVPIEDIDALATAMKSMVSGERADIDAEALHRHAVAIASPDAIITRLIEVYKEVSALPPLRGKSPSDEGA